MHGANLGFDLAAYDAVGGFPAVALAEDVAFVAAAHEAGLTMVYPTTIAVQTSARRRARATAGSHVIWPIWNATSCDATVPHAMDQTVTAQPATGSRRSQPAGGR